MRILFLAFVIAAFQTSHAQVGASFIIERNQMDLSAYNDVISKQLGEPVISSASAFLKFGMGLDFRLNRLTLALFSNSFASTKETRSDTSYGFQNYRLEVNIGYQVLQKQKLVIEPFLGWALNNTSYNKSYGITYSSISQYWQSPYSYKRFGYNLHHINAGLRIHFQKFSVNENAEIGFSLRTGMLIPLSNGNIRFLDQKTHPDQRLIQQSFYVGLIFTISTKKR